MWYLLFANTTFAYTHADTLRGSNGPGREWWDALHYDLKIRFDTATHSIAGENTILFSVVSTPCDSMQIDLQEPMIIDNASFTDGHKTISITKDNNVWWLKYPFHDLKVNAVYTITIQYHGTPREAVRPPWDGGFIWGKDSSGNPWIAVACQGIGASLWWPCKDAQWDEPDSGADMRYITPAGMQCISNGILIDTDTVNGLTQTHWQVKSPINNYDITFYIGDYVHWSDTLMGERGKLNLDFYALRYNEAKARKQFEVVNPMLHCFEYWMGPYPFYKDGYKLVEAPYLGMEHQGAVAYGNQYKMGYMGMDRSNTGIGLNFDFIIVHESGHEWFGNNVTAKDIADNWIHEGITTYTESLFAECMSGKEKAYEYTRGQWHNIHNDRPVIGDYGVNDEGSGDEYDKGAALVHMIRMIINNDDTFRNMLRSISKTYYHSTVSSKELEAYINRYTGINFTPLFNQYLRTTDIPEIEYYIKKKKLYYHFNYVVPGFTLPVEVSGNHTMATLNITSAWQSISWKGGYNVQFSKDFLVKIKT